MDIQPEPTGPLPSSVRWFMPWRWKQRWLIMLLPMVLSVYGLSSTVVIYCCIRTNTTAYVWPVAEIIYKPLEIVAGYCPVLSEVHRVEMDLLVAVFGSPYPPPIAYPPMPSPVNVPVE